MINPKGLTEAHMKLANIPEDYWECDFQNYMGEHRAAWQVYEYLVHLEKYKHQGLGFILVGEHGTGKTTLAYIVMKYLVRARWDCHCTSLGEIIESIQRSWKSDDGMDITGRCREATFLLIDDLGKEHRGQTEFVERAFGNLIRSRVQHRHPTLITSNLTKSEIQRGYGDSTLSLLEGKLIPITVNGDDHRVTVQKKEIKRAGR